MSRGSLVTTACCVLRLQTAETDGFQIWKVAVNMLNKGRFSSLGLDVWWAKPLSVRNRLRNVPQGL